MTLFTRKGDDGTANFKWGCNQRISKNSAIAEALGSLDEVNSYLGLCKVQAVYLGYKIGEKSVSEIVHDMQKNLFIIQAELAGADKTIDERKVKYLEEIIDDIDEELPPIKTFFISGGQSEMPKWQLSGAGLGAIFDIARTITRRAERRAIAVTEEISQPTLLAEEPAKEESEISKVAVGKIGKHSRSYLNRLSSALYALARFCNHKVGIAEEAPDYR